MFDNSDQTALDLVHTDDLKRVVAAFQDKVRPSNV